MFFTLIGCDTLSPGLSLPIFFNNNNINICEAVLVMCNKKFHIMMLILIDHKTCHITKTSPVFNCRLQRDTRITDRTCRLQEGLSSDTFHLKDV